MTARRHRPVVTLTLSKVAHAALKQLAEDQGMSMSGLVELWTRQEAEAAGLDLKRLARRVEK